MFSLVTADILKKEAAKGPGIKSDLPEQISVIQLQPLCTFSPSHPNSSQGNPDKISQVSTTLKKLKAENSRKGHSIFLKEYCCHRVPTATVLGMGGKHGHF